MLDDLVTLATRHCSGVTYHGAAPISEAVLDLEHVLLFSCVECCLVTGCVNTLKVFVREDLY